MPPVKTVAYVSIDATGVPIQGRTGGVQIRRAEWPGSGKVFAPKPQAQAGDGNQAARRGTSPLSGRAE